MVTTLLLAAKRGSRNKGMEDSGANFYLMAMGTAALGSKILLASDICLHAQS
jgi:hypothetical protein